MAVKAKKRILRKRSIVIAGHKTSVSLEEVFWTGVKEIAAARNVPVNKLVSEIAEQVVRKEEYINLSSALRVLVAEFYRGHVRQEKRRAKSLA
jgi:predicted DNA-binding ribbon-helix-helix protein